MKLGRTGIVTGKRPLDFKAGMPEDHGRICFQDFIFAVSYQKVDRVTWKHIQPTKILSIRRLSSRQYPKTRIGKGSYNAGCV